MKEKSIIITGAGIAGLSAGCFGQMNGYRTQIFEMNSRPGGCCTTWERDGYKVEGCLHWLTGSRPGNVFYPIWEQLGALDGRAIVDHEEYARIEGEDGKAFIVYSDLDCLEQHMFELAPEDKEVIVAFTDGVRTMMHFPMPIEKPRELYSPTEGFKIMRKMRPYFGFLRTWEKVTIHEFAQRFKNPFMRQVFPLAVNLQNDTDFPMMGFLQTLAWMDQKTAGYPIGGSLDFARAIERRYLGLGGEIHYRTKVGEILIEDDRAVGVRLIDGSEYRADYVVSAADGYTTFFHMLDRKYLSKKLRRYYDGLPRSRPVIYIVLGVAQSFEEFPQQVTGTDFPLDEPITISGQERDRLNVQIYNFDSSLAPAGKTLVRVYFATDYAYWKSLKEDPRFYATEKDRVADLVVHSLDRRFPGLARKVEMRDVSTPLTFEARTGNWQGTFLSWKITTRTLRLRMKKSLPRLKNFYMAGQWVEPGGGVPTAALSARDVIQFMCKEDKQPFISTAS